MNYLVFIARKKRARTVPTSLNKPKILKRITTLEARLQGKISKTIIS